MLRDKETSKQKEYEIVLLDDLVPQDHILRKIDAAVDFSFIHDLCKDLYSPNIGRPAIEPELLFRMLFLGYLYGIKSETKLAQEVNENIAFKRFLGLRLTEKGPDHATISANRVRRFRDNNIAEKIFDNILQQCINRKLVGGNILYTDSTHIKAKANKHRKTLVNFPENCWQRRNIIHIGGFHMYIDDDIVFAVYSSVFAVMKSVGLSFPTLLSAFRISQAFHLRFPTA